MRWLLPLLALAALGAAACDSENGQVSTPGPNEIGLTPVVTVGPRPAIPTPIITDNLLEDPAKGYAVRIPEGWYADPNIVSAEGIRADAFFAPDEVRGVQPNISVVLEDLSAPMTGEEYLASKLTTLEGIGAEGLQVVAAVAVSGEEAAAVEYRLTRDSAELAKWEVIFLSGQSGWVISLSAPAGEEASYGLVFQEFVQSFRLLTPSELTPTAE